MFFRKRADNANTTVLPQPINVAASGDFDGNDGKWSSFYINLGDDGNGRGQNFKVLISTSSPLTLVPDQSEWCNEDCAKKRGIQVFNGEQSLGFDDKSSHAWKDAGLFSIPLPHWWSGNNSLSGTWGSENVGLGESSKQSLILSDQFAVEYTFEDFFMGSFGLAAGQVNSGAGSKPPFLYNFAKGQPAQIPSVSYGYTAGASYRNNGNGVVGSLVLGGYDQSRVKLESNSGVSIGMPNDKNNTLVVGVPSILYKPDADVEANAFSFTSESKGFSATIDSTLPYLWLPDPVCDHFEERFQLTYDKKANLYTVNATARRNNQQQNATVSFKITNGPQDSNEFANINLPYSAFDLQLDFPIKENSTQYFPLKRSPNGMYVLGRTFLQEAYIIVDYERTNFTVAPAVSSDTMQEPKLVPIYNTTYVSPGSSPTPIPSGGGGGGLSPGAVAGIVVGIVVVFLLAGVGAFFYWKRRRQAKAKVNQAEKASEIDTMVAGNEVKHRRVSELDSEPPGSPKPSLGGFYSNGEQKDVIPFPPISEMESPPVELYSPPVSDTPVSEGNGTDYFNSAIGTRRCGATRESSGNNTPGALTPSPIAELPGDDGQYQVGGVHFEPVASPKASLVHSRGTSENSLHTNIDAVMTRTDPSPERKRESQPEPIAEESEKAEKQKGKEEEAKEDEKAEPEQTLERRPSHTRGLSDTTIQSESTAVSQPSPEELERWAMGEDDGPRRPLSE